MRDTVTAGKHTGNFPAPDSAPRAAYPRLAPVRRPTPWRPASLLAQLGAAATLSGLLMVTGPVSAAEVYKWRDADGHLHFGDRPPATQSHAESVIIRSAAPAAANEHSQERLKQVLDGYAKEREAREASRAAALAEDEQREQACMRAKARRQTAERVNVMYEYTPQGERRVLGEAEHKQVIEKAREAVADSCDQP